MIWGQISVLIFSVIGAIFIGILLLFIFKRSKTINNLRPGKGEVVDGIVEGFSAIYGQNLVTRIIVKTRNNKIYYSANFYSSSRWNIKGISKGTRVQIRISPNNAGEYCLFIKKIAKISGGL